MTEARERGKEVRAVLQDEVPHQLQYADFHHGLVGVCSSALDDLDRNLLAALDMHALHYLPVCAVAQ